MIILSKSSIKFCSNISFHLYAGVFDIFTVVGDFGCLCWLLMLFAMAATLMENMLWFYCEGTFWCLVTSLRGHHLHNVCPEPDISSAENWYFSDRNLHNIQGWAAGWAQRDMRVGFKKKKRRRRTLKSLPSPNWMRETNWRVHHLCLLSVIETKGVSWWD